MQRAPLTTGLALAASLALTSCGSTVASSAGSAGGAALQNTGSQGLNAAPSASTPSDGSAVGSTGILGATGTNATESTISGGIGTSSGKPTGSVSGNAVGTTGGGAALGPGVGATTISLGIPYCNDCASANAALGGGGQDPGDTRRYIQTALDDVNHRGGVLGRKLVPMFHQVSASDNVQTTAQAECETFTKDHKVLAIFDRGEIIFQCAKKAGILVIGAGGTGETYARYPNLFAAPDVRLDRLGAVTVKAMNQAGWFTPQPKWPTGKIGLITWDNNDYHYAMTKGWLPALHATGHKEEDVRYVAVPQSDRSLADASAAVSSAVLSFQQKGIDHVFIGDGPAGVFDGTGLTFLFLNTAKSQRYYPRYGFNTNNTPGWSNHPADEESGMLAVDSADYDRTKDAGVSLNPQRERCFALMTKAGLPVGDLQTQALALNACEVAWFTEAVLRHTRGTLLPDMIAAGESLGTSYRSPWSYGNRLSHGQRDGAALFRNSAFDDACGCMKYTSKPYEP